MNELSLKLVLRKVRNNRRTKCRLTLPVGETAQKTKIIREAGTAMITDTKQNNQEKWKSIQDFRLIQRATIQIQAITESHRRRGLALCAILTPIQCVHTSVYVPMARSDPTS